jgi:hypothetical protein
MADIRKTVGDLDTRVTFDGTEQMEVFPTSQGKSFKKKVGTAAERDSIVNNESITTGLVPTVGYMDIGGVKNVSANYTLEAGVSVVNATFASGNIVIPSGLPIGKRVLIRKLSAYDTTNVNRLFIEFSGGEACTPQQLTTLSVYGNGGNWEIEKVSSVLWQVVGGWDRGIHPTNGRWHRDSTGVQYCANSFSITLVANTRLDLPWTFPLTFPSASQLIVTPIIRDASITNDFIAQRQTVRNRGASSVDLSFQTNVSQNHSADAGCSGRWYLEA